MKKYFLVFLFSFIFIVFSAQKAFADSCEAGETCTNMVQEGTSWVSPDGMDCYWRNVCPSSPMQACCKKTSTATNSTSNATATASNASTYTPGSTAFTNPLAFNTVEGFVGTILSAVRKIIVSLALVSIVIGALMYIFAGVEPKNAERGKEVITMALVGLAIGIAAPSILQELGNVIGWGDVNSSAVAGSPTFSMIAIKILNFLLGIAGILSLIMMVIGAIMYLTAGVDEDNVKSGKNMFKYSLIGVIIAMSAMILVQQIAKFFT